MLGHLVACIFVQNKQRVLINSQDILESKPVPLCSCMEPEQSFKPHRRQPEAATSTVMESEQAVVSSAVVPEQSFEPPHNQPQDVASAIVDTVSLELN